jgi:hypothetical protein
VLQHFDPLWALFDMVVVASFLALPAMSVLQIRYRSQHGRQL